MMRLVEKKWGKCLCFHNKKYDFYTFSNDEKYNNVLIQKKPRGPKNVQKELWAKKKLMFFENII